MCYVLVMPVNKTEYLEFRGKSRSVILHKANLNFNYLLGLLLKAHSIDFIYRKLQRLTLKIYY